MCEVSVSRSQSGQPLPVIVEFSSGGTDSPSSISPSILLLPINLATTSTSTQQPEHPAATPSFPHSEWSETDSEYLLLVYCCIYLTLHTCLISLPHAQLTFFSLYLYTYSKHIPYPPPSPPSPPPPPAPPQHALLSRLCQNQTTPLSCPIDRLPPRIPSDKLRVDWLGRSASNARR